MRVNVISGSRADYGLLAPVFGEFIAQDVEARFIGTGEPIEDGVSCAVVLGDRHEILRECIRYYMQRIPIAHLCGGDKTQGSYDDAFRDCISRLAAWHFVSNACAKLRLERRGYANVHLVGSTSVDVVSAHRSTRRIARPYVVVSYQPETATGVNLIDEVLQSLPPDKIKVIFLPNEDTGSEDISRSILRYAEAHEDVIVHRAVPHALFLDLLDYCDEFIGNSSSMLYEAPLLGVNCRMVGDRQKGRIPPQLTGQPSKNIVRILKEWFKSSQKPESIITGA